MRLLDRLISRQGYWEGMASGAAVLTTTYGSPDREALLPQFTAGTMEAHNGNGIVFGAIAARVMLLSEATFKFQDKSDKSLSDLPPRAQMLENPWPNGTTGELIVRMEQDVSLAGNAYIWNAGGKFVRLRPDWVTIISRMEADPLGRFYRVPIGYWFEPPITDQPQWGPPQLYDVDEVAHWSPYPDPWAQFRGMSWLTPVLREIQADNAMTAYKNQYLSNAATPNLLLKYQQKLLPETVDRIRERVQARYAGVGNAFQTLVLDQGADATVVGHSFEQMNFSTVQAAGENRILIASRVPGIVIGSKEGLMAATYSNYQQAMRSFADLWARPTWRSLCACLSALVPVPSGQRLWYDTSDIAALRQGEKERADTMLVKAEAISKLVQFGYDPASAVAAMDSGDLTQLKHPGQGVDYITQVPKASPESIHLADPNAPQPPALVPAQSPNGSAPAKPGT